MCCKLLVALGFLGIADETDKRLIKNLHNKDDINTREIGNQTDFPLTPSTARLTPKDTQSHYNHYVTSQKYHLGRDLSQKRPHEKTVFFVKSDQSPTLKSPHPHSVRHTNVTDVPVGTQHIYMKIREKNNQTERIDSGYVSRRESAPTPKSVTIVTPSASSSSEQITSSRTTNLSSERESPSKLYDSSRVGNTSKQEKMSYYTTDIISPTSMARKQEKEDLKYLNERFSSYVSRVRQLSEHNNQLDSASFIKQTRILEEEVANLKTLYERELDALR